MGSPNWKHESVAFAAVCLELVVNDASNLNRLCAVYVSQVKALAPAVKLPEDRWRRKIRTALKHGEREGLCKFTGTNVMMQQPCDDPEAMAERLYRATCICYRMPSSTLGLSKDFKEEHFEWRAVRKRIAQVPAKHSHSHPRRMAPKAKKLPKQHSGQPACARHGQRDDAIRKSAESFIRSACLLAAKCDGDTPMTDEIVRHSILVVKDASAMWEEAVQ